MSLETTETAILGNGCFWCTEAIFQKVPGVLAVQSGYTSGTKENPTYEEVCTGSTNHAECLKIEFDPAKVSFRELLRVFFETHDPTTLNRQGNDVGTQYRSVIFYTNDEQKKVAEEVIAELTDGKAFAGSIVTQLEPAAVFYPAENYHNDYFNRNGTAPYCNFVIRPKVEKFMKSQAKTV